VNAKKGLSALQLKRDLKGAYKTAWYLSHRIRKAMGLVESADEDPLEGTVEVDEADIGSKRYDKRRKRGKYDKAPVFSAEFADFCNTNLALAEEVFSLCHQLWNKSTPYRTEPLS
jgi:hypothetical protein